MAETAQDLKTVPSAEAPAQEEIIGDFRLIAKLGAGGMGAVYKAHQISMDRTVALKILAAELSANPEFVERFRREARMSARLDHVNVIRGITVGEDRGLHYFAMEFVDGENLSEVLARIGHLAIPDAVKITLDVARALEQAAKRGLVHRDIKPANIRLTKDDKIVKLADLGLAKVTASNDGDLTATGVFFGTPPYMAPEQFRNSREVDGRSDIYSLGATLYYLVTGEKPFKGGPYDILEAKERGQWKPASQLNADVPAALDRIITKMLQAKVEDRHQSATELIADLDASGLAGREISLEKDLASATTHDLTRPTTPSEARGLRRRSTLAAAIATVALIAAVIAIVLPKLQNYLAAEKTTPPPAPPKSNPTTGMMSPGISLILTRAFGELAVGQVDDARNTLRRGLERYPTAAALERPLRELEQGALVLFQYQTPDETLPLAPVSGDEDLALTAKDNYRFAFFTARPCFFYAYDVDQRPSVSRVFPNAQFSPLQNPLPEGKVHWLPESDATPGGSWLHLDEFKGAERVYFVGLTRPLRDPEAFGERRLADASATVAAIARAPGEFVGAGAEAASACFGDGPVQQFQFRHE